MSDINTTPAVLTDSPIAAHIKGLSEDIQFVNAYRAFDAYYATMERLLNAGMGEAAAVNSCTSLRDALVEAIRHAAPEEFPFELAAAAFMSMMEKLTIEEGELLNAKAIEFGLTPVTNTETPN